VYVTDAGNVRVQKFTGDGKYITKWGKIGQFNSPSGVAVDSDGNVYVIDRGNYRVQKFTNDGTYITEWGSKGSGQGQFNSPIGVAVDSSGNVYVTDGSDTGPLGNNRVQKFGRITILSVEQIVLVIAMVVGALAFIIVYLKRRQRK